MEARLRGRFVRHEWRNLPAGEIIVYHDFNTEGTENEYVTCITEDDMVRTFEDLMRSGKVPNKDFDVFMTNRDNEGLSKKLGNIYKRFQR